ncbi:hypothetical protein KY284_011027 [Solanum tuberosum]|nr:hypothetical protein KY284_011027 [Solanum tuberosum]
MIYHVNPTNKPLRSGSKEAILHPGNNQLNFIISKEAVDVGNFLRLKSCVLYTELENLSKPLINVEVVAHVMRPELRSSEVSNNFYFTFTVHQDSLKNGARVWNVVPGTEEEARRVIERIDAENSCS